MEILEFFDKNGRLLGAEKRDIVHSKGLFHRTVNVLVLNTEGMVFLQKRCAKKDICPSSWDISAAEHLKQGEDYQDAAKRCLKEELGIDAEAIKIRGVHLQKNEYENGKKDYELVELYKAVCSSIIKINKYELEDGKFFRAEDIEKLIASNKNAFTPWFLDEWSYIRKVIIN